MQDQENDDDVLRRVEMAHNVSFYHPSTVEEAAAGGNPSASLVTGDFGVRSSSRCSPQSCGASASKDDDQIGRRRKWHMRV